MFYSHYLDSLDLNNVISAIKDYEQNEAKHIRNLYNYYNGQHPIKNRTTTEGRPCNNVVDNRLRSIADSYIGFINVAGVETSDQFILDNLPEIQDTVKDAVITGVGYSLVYYDKELRIKRLYPTTSMLFRDTTLTHSPVGAAFWNYYTVTENGFSQEYVDLYIVDIVNFYYYKGKTLDSVTLVDTWKHNIPTLPVLEARITSHYDSVIQPGTDLQDLLNLVLSGYADSRESNSDPFLLLTGIGISEESAAELVDGDRKLLNLPLPDAKAEYLQRPDSGVEVMNVVEGVDDRIYAACNCPNFTSETKMASASGQALKARTISFVNSNNQYRKSLDNLFNSLMGVVGDFPYEWPSYWAEVEDIEVPIVEEEVTDI